MCQQIWAVRQREMSCCAVGNRPVVHGTTEISLPPCRGTGILKITVLLGNRPPSRNLGLLGERVIQRSKALPTRPGVLSGEQLLNVETALVSNNNNNNNKNSASEEFGHPDVQIPSRYVTPKFKPFSVMNIVTIMVTSKY